MSTHYKVLEAPSPELIGDWVLGHAELGSGLLKLRADRAFANAGAVVEIALADISFFDVDPVASLSSPGGMLVRKLAAGAWLVLLRSFDSALVAALDGRTRPHATETTASQTLALDLPTRALAPAPAPARVPTELTTPPSAPTMSTVTEKHEEGGAERPSKQQANRISPATSEAEASASVPDLKQPAASSMPKPLSGATTADEPVGPSSEPKPPRLAPPLKLPAPFRFGRWAAAAGAVLAVGCGTYFAVLTLRSKKPAADVPTVPIIANSGVAVSHAAIAAEPAIAAPTTPARPEPVAPASETATVADEPGSPSTVAANDESGIAEKDFSEPPLEATPLPAASVPEVFNEQALVIDPYGMGNIVIRSQPSENSDVLEPLSAGDKVSTFQQEDRYWWKVKLQKGTIGFVPPENLRVTQ